MPTITDSAVVIRRWDFSETSQTVSLLTREHGIVRGLAKGAKRDKAAFSGGLDLLAEGEIVAIIKSGRDLATLTAWHLQRTHRVLHESLPANRAALYMADLVHHLMVDHDPHPRVFEALSDALALIDADAANADIALLRLQWISLREAGYRPDLSVDESEAPMPDARGRTTVMFSALGGGVIDTRAAESLDGARTGPVWRVRRQTIDVLVEIAAGRDVAKHDRDTLRRANRLLAVYCREIIGSEPAAMRWAFPDLHIPRAR